MGRIKPEVSAPPPEKLLALAKQEKLKEKQRTEVRLVGTAYGFKIYDVFYYFSQASQGSEETRAWKAILVRTGPNQFREIWHFQKTEGEIWPSYILQIEVIRKVALLWCAYRFGSKVLPGSDFNRLHTS